MAGGFLRPIDLAFGLAAFGLIQGFMSFVSDGSGYAFGLCLLSAHVIGRILTRKP